MNRFVKTALAIAVAGSAAHAGTGDNEWSALDSEISGLASSLQPSQEGMGWAALIRAVYSLSSDDIATGGPSANGPDLSGFNFNDVDLAFWASFGSYMLRISTDISDNEAGANGAVLQLEDAYLKWNCGGYFDGMVGNFKPRVTRSNSVDPENLLFIDRSALGSSFDSWDNGIGLNGTWEQLHWFFALMNGGGDLNSGGGLGSSGGGHVRDHLYVLRGEWDIGSGAGRIEGAQGSSDMLNGTFGLSYINDDTVPVTGGNSDTNAWAADFHGNVSNVGFGGEVFRIGDDYVGWGTDEDYSNIFDGLNDRLEIAEDSTPWDLYASYLINPEWEVGVRWENLDNDVVGGSDANGADNTVLSVVANYYGSNSGAKWQAQYTDIQAGDSGAPEGSIIEVGVSVGSTR